MWEHQLQAPIHTGPMVDNQWSESEDRLRCALAAERLRLERAAGLDARPQHFRRPAERPVTAAERDRVTFLVGGLTWKHETLIRAVFEHAGYHCGILPTPDLAAFQLGKDYGNNGQCNPSYFCIGSLLQYLRGLEREGHSRQEIIDRYVFFTSGTCGPCRFGMYEAEYRFALRNAGFDGFRVLLFQQNDGVRAVTGEPGLRFTVDLGMGALAAFLAGDVLNDLHHLLRPFEALPGETDRVLREAVDALAAGIRTRQPFELLSALPGWVGRRLDTHSKPFIVCNSLGKVASHLYGAATRDVYRACRDLIGGVEVDWLRVKPVVKIVGEFWAQTTEGDGNFRMFEFLEHEGAQVLVEPVGGWVTYLLHQRRLDAERRLRVDATDPTVLRPSLRRWLRRESAYRGKTLLFGLGERFWTRQYDRVSRALGGAASPLPPQSELARLAHPFYHQLARGGEGHLEVGKSIYYTSHARCHMVLSLKPFGCLPSTQSDGVHAAVVSRYPDMIFLPIETSGEGEINAYSRVQMALGEAKARARAEFAAALARTGRSLAELRAFVGLHPELRSPFYPIPRRDGVAGLAASFALHLGDVLDGRCRIGHVPSPPGIELPRQTAGEAAGG
jgi:predicted nucleotide-binding protein (sugar kinase/HSP70/actin superfamily)